MRCAIADLNSLLRRCVLLWFISSVSICCVIQLATTVSPAEEYCFAVRLFVGTKSSIPASYDAIARSFEPLARNSTVSICGVPPHQSGFTVSFISSSVMLSSLYAPVPISASFEFALVIGKLRQYSAESPADLISTLIVLSSSFIRLTIFSAASE